MGDGSDPVPKLYEYSPVRVLTVLFLAWEERLIKKRESHRTKTE